MLEQGMNDSSEYTLERVQRRLSVSGNDCSLHELATGRLYLEGEPEVRLRTDFLPEPSSFFLVTTLMGDGDMLVGLTASLFQATLNGEQKIAEEVAKADIVSRVEMSRGKVLSQQTKTIDRPGQLRTFMVTQMLKSARPFVK